MKLCTKHPYKSKENAVHAMHLISSHNKDDGRKKPVRAYKCEDCNHWHLTSIPLEKLQDWGEEIVLKYDWSKLV